MNGNVTKSKQDFSLKEGCHISKTNNESGFVGIKVNLDEITVCFPLGYRIGNTDNEIRKDIRMLITVLSKTTEKKERLLVAKKESDLAKVEFPINSYKYVIESFIRNGGRYYMETEHTYKINTSGKLDWRRTIKTQKPIVQYVNNSASFIYLNYVYERSETTDKNFITIINKYCVTEAFKRIGWLYTVAIPKTDVQKINIKAAISFLQTELATTNNDKKKMLIKSMKNILEFLDEEQPDRQYYFGVEKFEHPWEKMIDGLLSEKNKQEFFASSIWYLKHNGKKGNSSLQLDTIMRKEDNYYVLDGKYYKYGDTARIKDLPATESIHKQITYAENIEIMKGIPAEKLFNAFILPYDKSNNYFNVNLKVYNAGEAISEWKTNEKYYEHVQTILVDTKYLIQCYLNDSSHELKEELIQQIEEVKNIADNK